MVGESEVDRVGIVLLTRDSRGERRKLCRSGRPRAAWNSTEHVLEPALVEVFEISGDRDNTRIRAPLAITEGEQLVERQAS